MTDPNAAPESLELRELRALRSDVAVLTSSVRVLATQVELVREAVLGLGGRVGRIERERLTPLPTLTDSWMPDHGDNGR